MQALAGVTVLRCVWLRYLTLTVPIRGWTSVPSEEGGGGGRNVLLVTSQGLVSYRLVSIYLHLNLLIPGHSHSHLSCLVYHPMR